MVHDVFISYSHRDRTVADAACARLEQAGHRCWIAPRDVGGGEWGKAIIEGIRSARVFILIFSGHANRSPQVSREVERAVSHGLPIIPLRIEDVAPSDSLEYFISNQHWLDALTPPLERHLEKLVTTVAHLLDQPAPPSVGVESAPVPPRRWSLAAIGIAAAIVLAALLVSLLWLPRGKQDAPATPDPQRRDASPTAAPAVDWLFGRWCVDGDQGNTQTISGNDERIVTLFSGQRQVETVRSIGEGSVTTDTATYSRRGAAVIVSEPSFSYRLERCR